MLGTNDTAAENAGTSLLYAGEQYDSDLSHYYLRARKVLSRLLQKRGASLRGWWEEENHLLDK